MSLTRPKTSFLKKLRKNINKSFPLQLQAEYKIRHLKQPWMTSGLLKSARRQEQLYIKLIKDPTEENKTRFQPIEIKTNNYGERRNTIITLHNLAMPLRISRKHGKLLNP